MSDIIGTMAFVILISYAKINIIGAVAFVIVIYDTAKELSSLPAYIRRIIFEGFRNNTEIVEVVSWVISLTVLYFNPPYKIECVKTDDGEACFYVESY